MGGRLGDFHDLPLLLEQDALAQTPIVPFPPLLTAMPGTLAFDLKEKLADYIKARVVPVN